MTGALLIPSLDGGGGERTTLILAREMQARGYPVELIVGRARGALAGEVPAEVPVVELGADRLRTAVPTLARYLRVRRPDYLMPTIEHASVLALLARGVARTKTPVVIRVANTLSEMAAAAATPMERFTMLLARRLYRRADALVACSHGMAEDLATFAGADPSEVLTIPNAAVSREIGRLAAAQLSHPWFSPGEPPVILAVGSLRTKKNLPLLLTAFAHVKSRRAARLMILGEGPERVTLERDVRTLDLDGSVSIPGFDTNPYRYMARCSVFALSSNREGLPGVLIEALACGANIVATDCRSGPREILADGRYGRLVQVGDVAGMAKALEAALAEPRTPPPESWAPYTAKSATDAYIRVIEGLPS